MCFPSREIETSASISLALLLLTRFAGVMVNLTVCWGRTSGERRTIANIAIPTTADTAATSAAFRIATRRLGGVNLDAGDTGVARDSVSRSSNATLRSAIVW